MWDGSSYLSFSRLGAQLTDNGFILVSCFVDNS